MTRIASFLAPLLLVYGLCRAADQYSTPAPRDGAWMTRHQDFVKQAQQAGDVDLLFLGDSITDFWRSSGATPWQKFYGKLKAVNFGIAGDGTQHVLWRVLNGELDGIHPKVVILMIGTNNIGPNTAPMPVAAGIATIINVVENRLPRAKILLLGIFPRGQSAAEPRRTPIVQVNSLLTDFDDGRNHRFLDIGAKFLQPDGTLSRDVMGDFLHPSPKGYDIWAQAMQPTLDKMLKPASH